MEAVTFIELPQFTRAIAELVGDSECVLFQTELMLLPTIGKVIPGAGGLRKTRMRLPGRGKRGGARVIYLYLEEYQTIVLFYVYTKSRRENLSPDELARLRTAAKIIKQEFRREDKRDRV